MTDYYLSHAGKKGMKWGYNNGVRNGKRMADNVGFDDPISEATSNLISETISKFEDTPITSLYISNKAKGFANKCVYSMRGLPVISIIPYGTGGMLYAKTKTRVISSEVDNRSYAQPYRHYTYIVSEVGRRRPLKK